MSQILRALGVDPGPFRVLLRVSLINDFRGALRSGMQTGKERSPLTVALWMNVFVSFMLSAFTFKSLDAHAFALFHMTIAAVMMAMLTIGEFGLNFFERSDADVVGHRPVSSRTYYAVKFANVLFFVTAFGLAMAVVPAILGVWTRGGSAWFPLLFVPLSALQLLFVTSFFLMLYSVAVRFIDPERVKNIVFYVQLVLNVAIFLGYQFVMQFTQQIAALGLDRHPEWLYACPPAWFAAPMGMVYDELHASYASQIAAGLVATVATVALCFRRLSVTYLERMQATAEEPRAARGEAPSRGGWAARLMMVRAPVERVGFDFVNAVLRHDRTARMRAYSSVAMMGALMIVYALREGGLADPYGPEPAFYTYMMQAMFLMIIAMLLLNVRHSQQAKAVWFLYAAPVRDYGLFHRGVKKAVFLRMALPMYALILAFGLWNWPPAHAALFTAAGLVTAYAVMHAFSLMVYDVPFSRENVKGEQGTTMLVAFLAMPVAGVLSAVQAVLAQWIHVSIAVTGVTLVVGLAFSAGSRAAARVRSPLAKEFPL